MGRGLDGENMISLEERDSLAAVSRALAVVGSVNPCFPKDLPKSTKPKYAIRSERIVI
jgi:hypothetical protein